MRAGGTPPQDFHKAHAKMHSTHLFTALKIRIPNQPVPALLAWIIYRVGTDID
jgi:hypothetical protein